MTIFVLDNYDSFTYNLVQRLGEIDSALDIRVARNDQITRDEIERMSPHESSFHRALHAERSGHFQAGHRVFRSPSSRPGVCLGHQCIGETYHGPVHAGPPVDARQSLADPS